MARSDQDNAVPETVPDGSGVESIARQLTGELICIGCKYNLRGLSIREVCPECGMSIRATLLGIVDPQAEELEELISPRLVANGLVLWSSGALLTCLCVWGLRIDELIRAKTSLNFGVGVWMSMLGGVGIILSGIGALALIRPHRRVGRLGSIRAAIGVSAYIPTALMYWTIYRGFDLSASMPLVNPGEQNLARSVLRIGIFFCIAIIIWGLRPNAVMLAMRSVIIRTGRIDRQSMYAVLASFGVAAVGDAINVVGILSSQRGGSGVLGDLLVQLHVVLVALGSVLITLGITNIVIDTLRLRPVLRHRGVGLGDVFETNREKSDRLHSR